MMDCGLPPEAAEDDAGEVSVSAQGADHRADSNLGSLVRGIAVDPCGDRREGDRDQPVLPGEAERVGISASQQLGLAGLPAPPDGADRVDDMPGLQAVA